MKYKFTILICCLFLSPFIQAQAQVIEHAYYYQIPETPDTYTAGTAIARMLDGLGFRYYWATETLRQEDLIYKPTDSSRTSLATIDHIYSLSKVIVNATQKKVNDFTLKQAEFSYLQTRQATLENIKLASETLKKASAEELERFLIVFKNSGGTSEFPFWNNINGPIADAIWHTGQVVLLRRASGNPFNSKVSVLQGKLRE